MEQLKHFVLYVIKLTALICIIGFFLLREDVSYMVHTVQHGEDVHALSEQYRGTLSEEKWIAIFERENNMYFGTYVYRGQYVVVPVYDTVNLIDTIERRLVSNS
mgnify:FL=1